MKPFALANSGHFPLSAALANDLQPDADGWALLLPYGEHRNHRVVERDGRWIDEYFLQVVDEAAVSTILANETGGWNRLKRAFIRRPIFADHPDHKSYVPNVVRFEDDKTPLGLVEGFRATARGLEFKPGLTAEGAEKVQRGRKFPSALIEVNPTGEVRDGAAVVRPCKLLSVGLTDQPNISGVDSLANAKSNTPAAKSETPQTDPMKQLLLGWLAAQGIVLANDSTDDAVFQKFREHYAAQATTVTALGNDKRGLADQVTALSNERQTLTTKVTDLTSQLSTINTQLTERTTALANMRQGRAEALVDLAITQGRKAVAERDAEIAKLINSGDKFDEAATALANSAVIHKTAMNPAGDRKGASNPNTREAAQQKILTLANSDPKYKGLDMIKAMDAIKQDHPALFEELNAKETK